MRHRGVTITETLVACLLLTSMISLVSTAVVRLGRQRMTTEHTRIALDELSNQLDRLTLLPRDELSETIDTLQVISAAAKRLPDPKLQARLTPTRWGTRVAVSLSWKIAGGLRTSPITFVGWTAAGNTGDRESTRGGAS